MALRDFFGRLRGGSAQPPTPEIPTPGPPEAPPPGPEAPPPAPEPAPEAPPAEIPPPEAEAPAKTGWFARLKAGLSRSTAKLTESVVSLLHKRRLDDEALEELEETLITADLGVAASRRIVDGFRRTRFGKEVTDEEVKTALADEIAAILEPVAPPAILSVPRRWNSYRFGLGGPRRASLHHPSQAPMRRGLPLMR